MFEGLQDIDLYIYDFGDINIYLKFDGYINRYI